MMTDNDGYIKRSVSDLEAVGLGNYRIARLTGNTAIVINRYCFTHNSEAYTRRLLLQGEKFPDYQSAFDAIVKAESERGNEKAVSDDRH